MLLRRMYSYSVAIYVYNYITQPINLIILPGKVQVQNTGISNIILSMEENLAVWNNSI